MRPFVLIYYSFFFLISLSFFHVIFFYLNETQNKLASCNCPHSILSTLLESLLCLSISSFPFFYCFAIPLSGFDNWAGVLFCFFLMKILSSAGWASSPDDEMRDDGDDDEETWPTSCVANQDTTTTNTNTTAPTSHPSPVHERPSPPAPYHPLPQLTITQPRSRSSSSRAPADGPSRWTATTTFACSSSSSSSSPPPSSSSSVTATSTTAAKATAHLRRPFLKKRLHLSISLALFVFLPPDILQLLFEHDQKRTFPYCIYRCGS